MRRARRGRFWEMHQRLLDTDEGLDGIAAPPTSSSSTSAAAERAAGADLPRLTWSGSARAGCGAASTPPPPSSSTASGTSGAGSRSRCSARWAVHRPSRAPRTSSLPCASSAGTASGSRGKCCDLEETPPPSARSRRGARAADRPGDPSLGPPERAWPLRPAPAASRGARQRRRRRGAWASGPGVSGWAPGDRAILLLGATDGREAPGWTRWRSRRDRLVKTPPSLAMRRPARCGSTTSACG